MRSFKQIARQSAQTVTPKTLVELWGQNRVLVEHHKGILRYGTEEILVGATFGALHVRGAELRLCCMSREQLFISGCITAVELEGRT